jgi:hypothetical protein
MMVKARRLWQHWRRRRTLSPMQLRAKYGIDEPPCPEIVEQWGRIFALSNAIMAAFAEADNAN